MPSRDSRTIALISWGDLFDEDFLDTLVISFATFRESFVGSWMFGYVDALRTAGVRTVIYVTSARVAHPLRFTHAPTGASVCVLPAPRAYVALRRGMVRANLWDIVGGDEGRGSARRQILLLLRQLAPYLAMPLGSLARDIRREGCEAILCQCYDHAKFDMAVLLGRLMRMPVYATHQGGMDLPLVSVERLVRPLSMRACSGFVVGTNPEIERLHLRYRIPWARLARVFNPVDLSVWQQDDRNAARALLGIPNDARVVVWHGRVEIAQKGLDILLDAWRSLRRARPTWDLRLLLVGTGSDAAKLRRLLAESDAQGVTWIDEFVHDRVRLRRYLSSGDVYVLPSTGEGFPVAPLEAMACRLPVVATDVHGVPDILEGGTASGGLIVPPHNAVALAEALASVLDDIGWARNLGNLARRRVEGQFSLEAVGRQLRAFLFAGAETRTMQGHSDDRWAHGRECHMGTPLVLHGISPSSVPTGGRFNVQRNGQSALYLSAERACRGTLAVMDNQLLVTYYTSPSLLTALVPPSLLRTSGTHEVHLSDGVRESNRLEFVVTERARDAADRQSQVRLEV